MNFDRAALKAQAKAAMRAARPSPIWVCLVMMLISALLSILSMVVSGSWDMYRRLMTDPSALQSVLYGSGASTGFIGWFLSVALDVMGWVLSVGLTIYMLRVWRRQKGDFGNLFDGFGIFFRAILITVLPALLVGLWSMIYLIPVQAIALRAAALTGSLESAVMVMFIGLPLLIPVIVASYAYRQATFLMLDNPSLSCWQCVGLSRQIMRGHKWESFKLDLSFLGWTLLCVIPFVALWVVPYMNVTYAGYYEYVLADYTARNAPPVDPQPPMV